MVNVFFTSTLSKANEVLKVVVLIACEADLCTYEKYYTYAILGSYSI